ncbi:MAG: Patatin-like phospholipase, partial [Ramlibacter sp.]|nr:Patatin-like phospholipase [Ramlibacter sp.]
MGISPQAMDRAALEQRRAQAGVEGDSVWGLALSGGGIRSATFCFGLLRGLARASSLRRFDYVSTVSGGGYIGAAFGRLFQGRNTPQHIEERLAGEDTLLLWWLR